jgi:uncharacterized membrane protein
MQARTLQLLLAPLILLAACGEETVTSPETAPQDPAFAKTTAGGTASYDAVVLDGGNGNAWAINDAGIAVGMAREGSGLDPYPALRWIVTSEGVTGPEALPMLDGVSSHQPVAVNSAGEIAGYFQKHQRWGAFIYSSDQMQALPDLENADESFAWDINDLGLVVGEVTFGVLNADGSETRLKEAVVWVNAQDKPTVLPLPEGYTSASARSINGEGLIVGGAGGPDVPSIGLTWEIDHTGQITSGPHILAAGFIPAAVNAEGDIIGKYGECGSALMRGDQLIMLSTDETCHKAADLTDAGADGTVKIVSGLWFEGAVLWTVDTAGQVTGPVDLGYPKTTRGAFTRGINNQGWIVGAGRTNRGDVPALWMPKSAKGDGDCNPHPRTGECR